MRNRLKFGVLFLAAGIFAITACGGNSKSSNSNNGDNSNSNAITADFTANSVSGPAPLTVQFTDKSAGTVTAWAWDFNNDGTVDSTEQNPSYTYTIPGTYSVKLSVTGSGGTNEKVASSYITVADRAPGSGFSSFEIAQFSDTHIGVAVAAVPDLETGISQINADPGVELLIITGDLTSGSTQSQYQSFSSAIADNLSSSISYYCVPGNHDYLTDTTVTPNVDGLVNYQNYIKDASVKDNKAQLYYSFDYKGIHFIGIYNAAGLDAAQKAWLEADLEANNNNNLPVIAFGHVPIVDHSTDTVSDKYLVNLLESNGLILWMNGDTHIGYECVHNNSLYAWAGKMSWFDWTYEKGIKSGNENSYNLFKINEDNIEVYLVFNTTDGSGIRILEATFDY